MTEQNQAGLTPCCPEWTEAEKLGLSELTKGIGKIAICPWCGEEKAKRNVITELMHASLVLLRNPEGCHMVLTRMLRRKLIGMLQATTPPQNPVCMHHRHPADCSETCYGRWIDTLY